PATTETQPTTFAVATASSEATLVEVEGLSVVRDSAPTGVADAPVVVARHLDDQPLPAAVWDEYRGTLPFTGGRFLWLVVTGTTLLGIGLALGTQRRRRRAFTM